MARPQKQIWAEEKSTGDLVITDGPTGTLGRTVKVERHGALARVFTEVVDQEQATGALQEETLYF